MLRRFCIRLLGFFVEILIILVLFVLPFLSPLGFAALTGALAFVTGLHLELSRVPFDVSYFHRTPTRFSVLVLSVVTVFEVLLRAIFTAIVALFVFLGSEWQRLALSAVAFGACATMGAWTLRGLAAASNIYPARWGYFRLAVLLGVAFSVTVSMAEQMPLKNIAWKLGEAYVRGLSMAELADVLHGVRAQADRALAFLFEKSLGPQIGRIAGVVLSIDTLQGFAIAAYAILIVEAGRFFDRWEWRGRTLAA